MKARFVLACAAVGVAATASIGPSASADQYPGTVGFVPGVVEPGHEFEINGDCSDPNVTTARVSSAVLEPVTLVRKETIPDHDSRFVLTAVARVKRDAVPGAWPVSFNCGTERVSGVLIVAAKSPRREALSIEPKKGAPGTTVKIEVICAKLQPISSAALQIGSVTTVPGGGEGRPYFEVTGKVKNVKPDTYRVLSTCDGKPILTSFTVLPSKQAPGHAQVPVKPKKAPETGDA